MLSTNKKLLTVLNGQSIWPPPVWLMRQAGRFLPEFRLLRQQADFLTRCMTPDLAVEITLQPIRRFAFDGAILFSDILILPWALGQDLQFIEGRGPVLPPIQSEQDLLKLNPYQAEEKTEPVLEAIRRLNKIVNSFDSIGTAAAKTVTLIGFTGSPFTVACYMVEGGSSKDFATVFKMMYENPSLFKKIINLLVKTTADYLCRQIEAGAEAVKLFDSWAGLLPVSLFNEYVIQPTCRIVRIIQQKYPHIPIIGFPRLAGTKLQSYIDGTGLKTVGIDQTADISLLNKTINPTIGFQGNIDPLCLLHSSKMLKQEIYNLCVELKNRPHILNLGHGVLPSTPVEHVYELVNTVRTLA
ncbi:uroporphyrinogen decarboxylase [Commensalibacter oyaizuii]|uniref:Uroporphyrinogen decarboxylase n=1 Tax=Commensalibacter oyaizuii TaxID=3043873 RepID=A0ABT6Q257_9PROT|nr:uroporphyrinogen decarboxylase [Commensalibacter sp. TBRC 16381]MDI2091204.1 uroporphyrinogen decarboxylase [Commensalibacter sp. TBRC 16381]